MGLKPWFFGVGGDRSTYMVTAISLMLTLSSIALD